MNADTYVSAEDSALLRSRLASYSGLSCLELGTGNAGALPILAERFSLVVGTDLSMPGSRTWSRAGANVVLADLGSAFRDGTFDLVAFNPPYLAGGPVEDKATDGGIGMEVPLAFLREALRVVKEGGTVLMLLNQDAPMDTFESVCRGRGFGIRRLASRRLFYEEISVYEATASKTGAEPSLDPEGRRGQSAG